MGNCLNRCGAAKKGDKPSQGRPGHDYSYCYSPKPKVNDLEVQEIESKVAVAIHFWGPSAETLASAPVAEIRISGDVAETRASEVAVETLVFSGAATSHECQNK